MPKRRTQDSPSTKSPSKWDRLSTRKNMEEWREKKRKELAKESWSSKEYKFGSFGSPVFMAVGDPYQDGTLNRSSRHGQQFKGSGKVSGKTFQKFTSVAAGTEYIDPYERRKREARAQKQKNLHPAFRPSGKSKPRKTLFLSDHDASTAPEDISKMLKRRKSQRKHKITKFKPRNLQTSPMAKGGYGVANTHIPIYGKGTQSIMEYGPSEYDAERELLLKEAQRHRDIIGDNKPFVGRISKRGQTTFSSDTAMYGKPKHAQTFYRRKPPTPTPKVQHGAPFRPSNPGKKGRNADKKMTFGMYPEHMDEPPKETPVYDASHLSLATTKVLPWKPNNQKATFTSSSLAMSSLENMRRLRSKSNNA